MLETQVVLILRWFKHGLDSYAISNIVQHNIHSSASQTERSCPKNPGWFTHCFSLPAFAIACMKYFSAMGGHPLSLRFTLRDRIHTLTSNQPYLPFPTSSLS